MFDPDKSGLETLMQIAITTLLFAALLFLAGLDSDPATAKYSPLRTLGITLPNP